MSAPADSPVIHALAAVAVRAVLALDRAFSRLADAGVEPGRGRPSDEWYRLLDELSMLHDGLVSDVTSSVDRRVPVSAAAFLVDRSTVFAECAGLASPSLTPDEVELVDTTRVMCDEVARDLLRAADDDSLEEYLFGRGHDEPSASAVSIPRTNRRPPVLPGHHDDIAGTAASARRRLRVVCDQLVG